MFDSDLTELACAYYKYYGEEKVMPLPHESGVEKFRGKQYVVLRRRQRILAVYEVFANNELQRLEQWPLALEKGYGLKFDKTEHGTTRITNARQKGVA